MTIIITKKEENAIIALMKVANSYGVFDKMANEHRKVLLNLVQKFEVK